MSSAASRLLREVRDIASQTIPVIFGEPEEADILHWRGMILGPPHTPYSLGLFHFDLKFPQDYPNSAPKVLITTTSGGHVRFNPNLYSTGKVCLSILGTWRAEHSGEQWSAVQSAQSILLSIQSLMNDAPYHNEPSFEADDGSGDVQRYNDKITHETLRVAVCEVMEDTLENRAASSNGTSPVFASTRRQLFFMYYQVRAAATRRHPPPPAATRCRRPPPHSRAPVTAASGLRATPVAPVALCLSRSHPSLTRACALLGRRTT